jgi:hypothetical protein
MSRIERSINRVMDSIELYDLDWLEDAANLIEEYTDLEDDSPAQDAAMYVYGLDGVGLFEVFIATYLYCVDYHDGQWSTEYTVQCQLSTAGLQVQGSIEDQDESIQDLYARMVEVHHA